MSTLRHRVMYVFPGQGAQYRGMGRDLYREFGAARRIYDRAGETVGYDVAELSFADPQERLGRTEYTQVALLTHSIACLEVFRELTADSLTPSIAAGHSLGEYSALVAAGSLTFETALRLVQKRGELMSAHGKGRMVALNLDGPTVKSAVNRFYCAIGGCNLPDQMVVGGAEEDLRAFVEYLKKEHGAGAVYLKTEGAFHTYLMIDAALHFRPILDATPISPPRLKVLSNHTGKYHAGDPSIIKAHLFFQLFNPVRWIWGMQEALKDRVNLVIELGGGTGGGEAAATKRPNLESIIRRTLKSSQLNGLYLPAINAHTLRESAQLLRALATLADEPHDSPENGVYDNWYHLFVPTRNRTLAADALYYVKRICELNLSEVVQLVALPRGEDTNLLKRGEQRGPLLELCVGCESAALIYFAGEEIEAELLRSRERRGRARAGH